MVRYSISKKGRLLLFLGHGSELVRTFPNQFAPMLLLTWSSEGITEASPGRAGVWITHIITSLFTPHRIPSKPTYRSQEAASATQQSYDVAWIAR